MGGQTMVEMEHHILRTNGVDLHVAQAGPADGPLVILLHGFPEYWAGWRKQIPALVDAGYRVWAPDQRGYNLSAKPKRIAAYSLDELVKDVIGLMDAAGADKVYLVGHDWGAAVAWWVANTHPDRLHKLVILNVPHPNTMQRVLRSSFTQLRKSWYMFFFQLPWLPEALIKAGTWRGAKQALISSSRPGTFTDADLAEYITAWSQPGAFTGMINWYRAMFRVKIKPLPAKRITVPTLLIWGAQDFALGRELAQPSIDRCDDGRLVFIEEAGHWVQHEEAERVNGLVVGFLGE